MFVDFLPRSQQKRKMIQPDLVIFLKNLRVYELICISKISVYSSLYFPGNTDLDER